MTPSSSSWAVLPIANEHWMCRTLGARVEPLTKVPGQPDARFGIAPDGASFAVMDSASKPAARGSAPHRRGRHRPAEVGARRCGGGERRTPLHRRPRTSLSHILRAHPRIGLGGLRVWRSSRVASTTAASARSSVSSMAGRSMKSRTGPRTPGPSRAKRIAPVAPRFSEPVMWPSSGGTSS